MCCRFACFAAVVATLVGLVFVLGVVGGSVFVVPCVCCRLLFTVMLLQLSQYSG